MNNDPPFDPWETATGGETYSPERIYTRSVDKRGFGTTLRAKAPPEVMTEVAKIVAKEWVPEYHTTADFVRDAIIHRLHYWSERISDKQLQRVVAAERRAAMLEHAGNEVKNAQMLVTAFEENLRVASTAGDTEVLEDMMMNLAEVIPVSREPYRSKLLTIQHHYQEAMDRSNGK